MEQHPDTTAVTSGRDGSGALSPALWTSTVWASSGVDDTNKRAGSVRPDSFYARYANPTVTQFESAVAELERAESALAFSSGMGAMAAVVFAFCDAGSHIVAQSSLYGGTLALLEGPCRRMGIETTFVDPTVPGATAAAVQPGRTRLVIVETPSNPLLALADLDEIGSITGPFTVVDSTVATPLGQRPLEHGIDMVVHSATKGISGHNDAMLGVVAGERDLVEALWSYAVLHGAVASPHDALNGLRGIRTLPVRLHRQAETSLAVARMLEAHPQVRRCLHTRLESHPQCALARQQLHHGESLLSFEIDGGREAASALVDRLRLVRPATSFGGPETLICHPASSTHLGLPAETLSAIGVTDGLLRVSVGLESVEDLLADFERALA